MVVKDIMYRNIIKVPSTTTVVEATRIMDKNNIGCVLATEGDKTVGIMTERDVLKKVVAARRNCEKTTVKEVMTSPLITIESDTTIEEANDFMEKNKIRRLVVTDNGKIAGIITIRDIARNYKYSIARKILGKEYGRVSYGNN